MDQAAEGQRHAGDVRLATSRLMRTLTEAETGQRGYLASGDADFLAEYRLGLAAWRERFGVLAALVEGDPVQQARAGVLQQLIDQKLGEMRDTIQERERGTAGPALADRMKRGEHKMDEIRRVAYEMVQHEEVLDLEQQRERAVRLSWTTSLMVGALVLFLLLMVDARVERRRLARETALLRELATTRAEREAMFAGCPLGLGLFDLECRFVHLNDQIAEFTGVALAENLGRSPEELLPPLQARPVREAFDRVVETRAPILGALLSRRAASPSGEPRTWKTHWYPVEVGRECVGVAMIAEDVTDRNRSDARLQESEALFRATFENAAVGMANVGLDDRWLRVNRRLCEITGYSREELQSRTFRDITYPEDAALYHRNLKRLLAGECDAFSIDKRYLRKDGKSIWVNSTTSLLRDASGEPACLVRIIQDIHARKIAEEERARLAVALDSERTLLRRVLASLPVGVGFADRASRAVTVHNDALLEILGRLPSAFVEGEGNGEALARGRPRRADGTLYTAAETPFARALDLGETVIGEEIWFDHPTKGLRAVRVSAVPVESQGMAPGALIAVDDVTDRLRARDALAASVKFSEHFLGILGHDLRNPLNAIQMTAFLLKKKLEIQGWDAKDLDRILASAQRMGIMVTQLLDLTRARIGGGIRVDVELLNLDELVLAAVDELRVANPDREIRCHLSPRTSGCWDPGRMSQVVSNLVGNAIQHGDPACPIEVSLRLVDGEAVLEVQNYGSPIPSELLPVIFDPYRQGGGGEGNKQGLGLGLYITQQIVLAHGGQVSVRSSSDEGTRFTVTLPRSLPARSPASRLGSNPPESKCA